MVTEDGRNSLSYRVVVPQTNQHADVTVSASIPIGVAIKLGDSDIPRSFLNQLYEDLFLVVQILEEELRKTTLTSLLCLRKR